MEPLNCGESVGEDETIYCYAITNEDAGWKTFL